MLFAIGRYLALADDIMRARDYLRRAMKLDKNLRSEFLDDSAFTKFTLSSNSEMNELDRLERKAMNLLKLISELPD